MSLNTHSTADLAVLIEELNASSLKRDLKMHSQRVGWVPINAKGGTCLIKGVLLQLAKQS